MKNRERREFLQLAVNNQLGPNSRYVTQIFHPPPPPPRHWGKTTPATSGTSISTMCFSDYNWWFLGLKFIVMQICDLKVVIPGCKINDEKSKPLA